jgi:hypothetical protein
MELVGPQKQMKSSIPIHNNVDRNHARSGCSTRSHDYLSRIIEGQSAINLKPKRILTPVPSTRSSSDLTKHRSLFEQNASISGILSDIIKTEILSHSSISKFPFFTL